MPVADRATNGEVDFSDASRRKSRLHPTDAEIRLFAQSRHGIVTASELRDLGLGERASQHRAASGRLHRLHRGVYSVDPPSQKGRWLAAVLACGDGAVLSHASAAALWDVLGDPTRMVHVNVVGAHRRARPGVVVHRAALGPDDVTSIDGIPCTTLARSLVDVAATIGKQRLERAVVLADELGIFDLRAVRAQLDRMPGQRGCGALARVLARYDDLAVTRSEAEARFLALVRTARLPEPEVNAWIPLPEGSGYRPDFLWRERRLIVEVDSRSHHAHRQAFEHDRRRDRRLLRAGFVTARFPAREVMRRRADVTRELRSLLSQES
jgi:very-short-patch-repair endonuclease/predicted transcriptional regulator of viral defense system